MLEWCETKCTLYAMIADRRCRRCLWNNRFYTQAIRLGRLKEYQSRNGPVGAGNVSEKKRTFRMPGRCTRLHRAISGMAVPTLLRGSQGRPHGSGAVDSFMGDLPIPLWRGGADALPRNRHRASPEALSFPTRLDSAEKEILLNGWTDYLENEFAATKQSAVLETVQQTERQRCRRKPWHRQERAWLDRRLRKRVRQRAE